MVKKRFIVLASMCAILLLTVLPFVACTRAPVDSTEYTVYIGTTVQGSTDNPFNIGIGGGDATHMQVMYEALVCVWFSEPVAPWLAESWSYDEASMTWTLKMDPDAKFNNGERVTAEDAWFTFDKSMEFNMGPSSNLKTALVQGTGATANTVSLELKNNRTIVRTTGSFLTDGWHPGEYVKVTGAAEAANNGTFKIAAVTATTITLTVDYNFTNEGPKTGITLANGGPAYNAIVLVDDDTLTFKIHTFVATFIRYLGNNCIVPKSVFGEMTNAEIKAYANSDPIASGPYKLVQREENSHMIYVANDAYWGGKPPIKHVHLLWFATEEAQLLALKAKQIDAINIFKLPTAVPQLLGDPNIKVFQISSNTCPSLEVNHRFAPWNLVAFRQAVSLAINRDDIITYAVNGWGNVPVMVNRDPLFADVVEIYDQIKWPGLAYTTQTERIAAANAALDAITNMTTIAGGTGGIRRYNGNLLQFDLQYPTNFTEQQTAAVQVRANLLAVGIDMTLSGLHSTVLVNNLYRQKSETTNMGWQTAVWGRAFTSDYDYFANQWTIFPSTDANRFSKRSWISGWSGTAATALSAKFAQIQALPEDNATRIQLVKDSMVDFKNELPTIPLWSSISAGVHRTDRFTGWQEDNGFIMEGAVWCMGANYNIMSLQPIK